MRINLRSVLSGLVIVIALLASVASSAEENTPEKVDEDGGSNDTDASGNEDDGGAPEEFTVGDLVQLGDWQVRVHAVTDPFESTNEFIGPAEGSRWVAVDVEVTNTSDEAATVSSILCFEVMDDQNRAYQMTLTAESSTPPDGEVPAGGSRRGTIVYEVPVDAAGLRLNFQCDLFSSGSATVVL